MSAIIYRTTETEFDIDSIILNGDDRAIEVEFAESGDYDDITFDNIETAITWASSLLAQLHEYAKAEK